MYVDATSLEEAFAYFTECQLATVEHLMCIKRTSKSELRRHQDIARDMVIVCRRFDLGHDTVQTGNLSRLKRALEASPTQTRK